MKMTPRERVMASVNHQNPDSLPMDLGSNVSAGISGMAYGKLKEYLGITTGHNRIYDVVQQVAQPEILISSELMSLTLAVYLTQKTPTGTM